MRQSNTRHSRKKSRWHIATATEQTEFSVVLRKTWRLQRKSEILEVRNFLILISWRWGSSSPWIFSANSQRRTWDVRHVKTRHLQECGFTRVHISHVTRGKGTRGHGSCCVCTFWCVCVHVRNVCMNIRLCMYIHICMCVCLHFCLCVCVCMYVIHVHVKINVYICTYMYYVYVCVYEYVYEYIYTSIHIYIFTYIRVCVYTEIYL